LDMHRFDLLSSPLNFKRFAAQGCRFTAEISILVI